jgi:probable HAF family extracellular repeat protein
LRDLSLASGVSADGSAVVGTSYGAGGQQAFYWTAETGMIGLGDFPGPAVQSEANAVSGDGLTVVGYGTGVSTGGGSTALAFKWTAATGLLALDDLPGGDDLSIAGGISFDGSSIVGTGSTSVGDNGYRAVLWQGGGPARAIDDRPRSGASNISPDGSTVVGQQIFDTGIQAFRWTEAEGMIALGDLPGGDFYSEATAASWDGSVIVGRGSGLHASYEHEAFRWTAESGLVGLGDLPGGIFDSFALATSYDGSIVVGMGSGSTYNSEAFIWDSLNGMRNLREVLIKEYGMTELSDWRLINATGISADGTTIVGAGVNPSGYTEAWRVSGIPEPSSAFSLLVGCVGLCGRLSVTRGTGTSHR